MSSFCIIALLAFTKFTYSYSEMGDTLQDQAHLPENQKREYLKDIPELNLQNLRLMIPAQDWSNYKKLISKGQFLKIATIVNSSSKKGYEGDFLFYEKPDKKSNPSFRLTLDDEIKFQDKICQLESKSKKESKRVQVCKSFYCKEENFSKPITLQNYKDLDLSFILKNENKPCPYSVEFFYESDSSEDTFLNIKLTSSPEQSEFAKVDVGGKTYYLDTSFCSEAKYQCNFYQITFSSFELAWINLSVAKAKKNYGDLNYFIQNLLPCVKKKDKKCIQKFFATKKDAASQVETMDEKEFVPVEVSNSTITDLEKCLSYESLLPYGGRTKAWDDRVCIFDREQKIWSITLPDAYRYRGEVKVNYDI